MCTTEQTRISADTEAWKSKARELERQRDDLAQQLEVQQRKIKQQQHAERRALEDAHARLQVSEACW